MDDGSSVPLWVTLVVAGIPALGAIIAAVIATVSAARAKDAQLASETERELRSQLAASKTEVYEPMIELLRKMLDATKGSNSQFTDKGMLETLSKFTAWIQVYGSDEAVLQYHKFMQAAFHSPPPEVLMYYYGAFLVAVRRDLGHPDTGLGQLDLLGLRIKDLWAVWGEKMTLPEGQFIRQANWEPPWPKGYGE